MKRIEAVIRPEKVTDVCAALDKAGVPAATVSSVEERNDHPGWTRIVRNLSYTVTSTARSKVEVVVNDLDVDRTVATISAAAATGNPEDGTIYIHDVAGVITIGALEKAAVV